MWFLCFLVGFYLFFVSFCFSYLFGLVCVAVFLELGIVILFYIFLELVCGFIGTTIKSKFDTIFIKDTYMSRRDIIHRIVRIRFHSLNSISHRNLPLPNQLGTLVWQEKIMPSSLVNKKPAESFQIAATRTK